MKRIALLPKHLGRYRELATLLVKYGRSDIVKAAGLEEALLERETAEEEVPPEAAQLAKDLEKLGPTYIKLGQLLSTRGDLLPEPYLNALSRLQDAIEPFPFGEVQDIVMDELGVRMSKAFVEFDPEPLAAASLGQVHRAILRDGRAVAVKVQRPDIRQRIREDLEAFSELAGFLDAHTEVGRRFHFTEIVSEFRKSLARELDYLQEAANLNLFRRNLQEFKLIVIPEPVMDYTTARVLTMDFVTGKKITDLGPLRRLELDGAVLAEELFRAYLKQILVDGVFHADPHPGNVFLTDDGRIALLDLGMTGHVTPVMQDQLLRLLLAIAEAKGETVAEISLDIGDAQANLDLKTFTREVAQLVALQRDRTVEQLNVGSIVLEITRLATRHGVRQPPELTLLGKALLNLDSVARTLAPDFQPTEAVSRHSADILRRRMLRSMAPENLSSTVLEVSEFLQRLPERLNKLLDRFADNRFEVKVNAIDEERLIGGIEKVANRITLGLVLAALIVGAAMLMRIETRFRILGYPGLAMVFFLAAAVGGLVLIYSIVTKDRHSQ